MANIATKIASIRNSIFGKDVRENIASGIEVINTEVEGTTARQVVLESTFEDLIINAGNSNAEIVVARSGEGNLVTKIGKMDMIISDKASKADVQRTSLSYKESYATLALLQAAYPNGNAYNHSVLADGLIYTYVNSGWVSTSIQANGTGIADESIIVSKIANFAVNENKTTFFTRTRNIYDARYNVSGMLNYLTGLIETMAGWVTSDYIPVTPGATIRSSFNGVSCNPGHIVYYNSSKQRISGTNSITSMIAPADCYYIKISNSSGLVGINQVELGSSPTAYIDPYIFDIKYLYNSDYNNELTTRILDASQTVTKQGSSIIVNSAKVDSICELACSIPKIAYLSKKNLIKMTAKTINGVTVTIEEDGSFTLNGTSTSGTIIYFENYIGYAPIGHILYRTTSYSGIASNIPEVNIGFTNDYIFSQYNLTGVQKVTMVKAGLINVAAIYSASGVTFTNFNMKIMVSMVAPTVFEANSTTTITVPTSITVTDSDFTITSTSDTDITTKYVVDSIKYMDAQVDILEENIGALSPWENKSVLFMGDSITALGGWVTQFNKVMKTASFINVAVSSAKWIEDSVVVYDGNPVPSGNAPQNVMGNQVQKVLNNDYAAPDIIIIACGTNDYIETSTIENQFTSAGVYIPLSSVQKNTFSGAMRYSIETLLIKYPLTQIFLCTPIQSAEVNRSYVTCKQRGDIITSVARRMGLPVINSEECGIYGMFENATTNGKYLSDGLHPNTAGDILLGNYNARQVANWFSIK